MFGCFVRHALNKRKVNFLSSMLLSEYYSLCKLFGNVVLFTELSTHYILIVGL